MKYNYWKGEYLTRLPDRVIYVFNSTLEGSHVMGVAKRAVMSFGAGYGIGRGLQGQSYALPVETAKGSLTPTQIRTNIEELYEFAEVNPNLKFVIIHQQLNKKFNKQVPDPLIKQFTQDIDVPTNIYFHDSYQTLLN